MEAVMPLSNAYKSAIRIAVAAGFQMTPVAFEESAIEEHREYYHQFDFGRALGEKPKLAAVFSRNDYYKKDFTRFTNTEYYVDYLTKYSVFDALCLSDREQDHARGAVLYLWHERELPDSSREKAMGMLRMLAPSFKAGIKFSAHLHSQQTGLSSVLENSSDGMILFNQNLVTIHRNPALALILADVEDQCSLLHSVMECATAVRDAHLRRGSDVTRCCHVSMTMCTGHASYAVSGCVLQANGPESCSILVSVTPRRSRARAIANVERLRDVFNLTQREIEVALMLRSRQTNHEIAMRLGVSDHTARHHTESVLRKLGVETRKEVAGVIGLERSAGD
jgi:DNA-binding CsgD family transcriptional regulator